MSKYTRRLIGGNDEKDNVKYKYEIMKSDDDHIYYNIVIANNNEITPIPAGFVDYRSDPIVPIPEEYHLSIIRFSVSGNQLPIFYYPNNLPTAPTANNTIFSVTLSYSGSDFQTFTIFVPAVSTSVVSPSILDYYIIESYQQFIDMVNTALSTSFSALKTAFPAAPPTQPPFFIFDPVSQLISLVAQKQYSLPGSVQIYLNSRLDHIFAGFDLFLNGFPGVNGKDVQLLVKNLKNNCYSTCPINLVVGTTNASPTLTSAGLFTIDLDGNEVSGPGIPVNTLVTFVNANTMTMSQNATATATINAVFVNKNLLLISQEYKSLFSWNAIKSVVVTTGQIPVKDEYVPTSAITGGNFITIPSSSSSTASNFLKILSDFEPQVQTGPDIFSTIQYLPTAEYRRIDLKGKIPLNVFDVNFLWQDQTLGLHQLYVPAKTSASIKFLFEKKLKFIK